MTYQLLTAMISFVFVASVTPGPNNVMLMASGANYGYRRTLPHMFGITFGMGLMVILVGLGIKPLFDAYPMIQQVLTVICVMYLCYLAWKVANASAPKSATGDSKPLNPLQAAGFQWVNPKSWTMVLSSITLFAAGREFTAIFVLALTFATVSLISVSIWTLAGQQLRRLLSNSTRLRAFNWTMAILLLGSLYPVIFGVH